MRSTAIYSRGRVVVVNVPFTNHSRTKRRPAVVMSTESFHRTLPDVIVCPISSQPRYFERPGPGDLPVRSWRAVGLHYPSTVRVSRSLAVQKKLLGRTLGKLPVEDLKRVEDTLRDALGL